MTVTRSVYRLEPELTFAFSICSLRRRRGMVATMTGVSSATLPAETQPPAYAPPDPKARARELLEESQRTLDEALQRVRSGEPAAAAELVGRASDRIGNALYFLRAATRRS